MSIRTGGLNRGQPPSKFAALCSQPLRACTFAQANQHLLCNSSYPQSITWANKSQTGYGDVFKLAPGCDSGSGACLFQNNPPPMRRIVVMGDSQAYRLMRYMLYVISRLGGVTCTMTADEAHLRAAYYNVSYTVTGRLSCSGCDSFRATCKSAINSVEIEYLRLAFMLDSELTTAPRMHFDGKCRHNQLPPCKWFWSSQQFLFEGYLRQRQPPPDHIHIFQNMHDCSRRSPADHRRDLLWFVDLLNATLLNSTSVHFWEAPHPNGAKQPEAWRNVTSPACMRMMNDAMRQAIRPFVERTALAPNASARSGHATWYGAFDLFTPTGARPDLNVDGVHMRPDWYETLAHAVIAGTCGLG